MPVNEFGCPLSVPEAKPQMLCTSRDFYSGNDVQHTRKICRLINCPKKMVGRVTGKKRETVKAIERAFAVIIWINRTKHHSKITITGRPGAVDDAAAAVIELINGRKPCLDTPGAKQTGIEGPEGGREGLNGAPSSVSDLVPHIFRLDSNSENSFQSSQAKSVSFIQRSVRFTSSQRNQADRCVSVPGMLLYQFQSDLSTNWNSPPCRA